MLDAALWPRIPRKSALPYRLLVLARSAGRGKDCCIRGGGSQTYWHLRVDSLEKAQAFYNSAAWKDLAPQRDKAVKTIRRYVVEPGN
jgi:hypothetical protein